MPKKVKLTYLKANEPLELPKRDLNTVPLSQKLINAQRDDFMQPVAERPSKMNRISSTTASTSMPADLMCGQCECAKACKVSRLNLQATCLLIDFRPIKHPLFFTVWGLYSYSLWSLFSIGAPSHTQRRPAALMVFKFMKKLFL